MTQAILAGFLIGIGDMILMSVTNQFVAAFLFCVALECVIYFELPLFTGMIGKLPWNRNWTGYLLALLFNVVGASFAVWLFTFLNPDSWYLVRSMADAKFANTTYLSLFVAGVLCNVLIHLACSTKHTIIVALCIMAFILCGFEHSIADAPYMILTFNLKYAICWLLVLLGNTVGAICTEWMLVFAEAKDSYVEENDDTTDDFDTIEGE